MLPVAPLFGGGSDLVSLPRFGLRLPLPVHAEEGGEASMEGDQGFLCVARPVSIAESSLFRVLEWGGGVREVDRGVRVPLLLNAIRRVSSAARRFSDVRRFAASRLASATACSSADVSLEISSASTQATFSQTPDEPRARRQQERDTRNDLLYNPSGGRIKE